MDEVTPDHLRTVSPSLASAIRRARVEEAERSDAMAELRGAEIARLEMLHEALGPVLAQVPEHIDLFDVDVVPGDRPRLFIDVIGFVQMGRDRRTYRFVQDTRHGRIIIAENEHIEAMVDAVTAYIARRLVEREKALAADATIEDVVKQYLGDVGAASPGSGTVRAGAPAHVRPPAAAPERPDAKRTGFGTLLIATLVHVIEYLGVVALLGLLIAGAFFAYHLVRAWLAVRYGFPAE